MGTCVARPILDGLGNVEEFRTDYQGGFVGMSLRLFDPVTRLWACYWADSRRCGVLEPPVIGSFSDGIGVFECDDTFDGRPIVVRYVWSDVTPSTARWEQFVLGRRRTDLGDELDGGAQPAGRGVVTGDRRDVQSGGD